jgi:hypothetical protein
MRLKPTGKEGADIIRATEVETSASVTYQEGFPMTRQLVAASLAVLMLAAPAIALAADPAPATDSAPAKKAPTHKTHKAKKAKKEAAPAQ